MEKQKKIDRIRAIVDRTKADYTAETDAMINTINADTDLKYSEIIAEARLIENKIIADA